MLDLISKIDKDRKVRYIWFDTGLEYQATKDHLKYLEEKYHIEIERIKAIKPIRPTRVSRNISMSSKEDSSHGNSIDCNSDFHHWSH